MNKQHAKSLTLIINFKVKEDRNEINAIQLEMFDSILLISFRNLSTRNIRLRKM